MEERTEGPVFAPRSDLGERPRAADIDVPRRRLLPSQGLEHWLLSSQEVQGWLEQRSGGRSDQGSGPVHSRVEGRGGYRDQGSGPVHSRGEGGGGYRDQGSGPVPSRVEGRGG